ncbi:hypothetical protein [Clostridium beijerinckii]|uniref:hypothetical protein n=1 Tax=Clostridium beijerinckii TaxID=1520 RepID=UPI00232AEBB8|nr:hypothetical protein [Clostridium beijerinckii]
MRFDMLEVKKDRLKEVDRQLRSAYRIKKISKVNQDKIIIPLQAEKKKLIREIKEFEIKRGE